MVAKQADLKQLIREAGHTQRSFAQKIRVGESELSRWVRREVTPIPRHRELVARELKRKPEEIWS